LIGNPELKGTGVMKIYCVYILTSQRNGTLYIGVTGNLQKRIWEHKQKLVEGFTKKYDINKLVYYEQTENIYSAIQREKQLKKLVLVKTGME